MHLFFAHHFRNFRFRASVVSPGGDEKKAMHSIQTKKTDILKLTFLCGAEGKPSNIDNSTWSASP
jgi:hypothetical protein